MYCNISDLYTKRQEYYTIILSQLILYNRFIHTKALNLNKLRISTKKSNYTEILSAKTKALEKYLLSSLLVL